MQILLPVVTVIAILFQHTLSRENSCNNIGDVVFVVDGSDSINDADFVRLKNFVANMITNLEIRPDAIQVGMIVYSSHVGQTIGLFPPKNKIILTTLAKNLEHPKFGTNTAVGIQAARKMMNHQGRSDAKKSIVVITDSRSINPKNTAKQANIAKEQGVSIISIGVGSAILSEELNQIASDPQYVSEIADFRALANTVKTMTDLICTSLTTPHTTTFDVITRILSEKLCKGYATDEEVGFNAYPGDCTKFVQCWQEGTSVNASVSTCSYSQFWDPDAVTCRPSFLVQCKADPCKNARTGFTYGMKEYGCRAYWQCIDGVSVGHCCPMGSHYVEGLKCILDPSCEDDCPPIETTVQSKIACDKKAHRDKRYYIQSIAGSGEVNRPCPAGTIFYEDECACDFAVATTAESPKTA